MKRFIYRKSLILFLVFTFIYLATVLSGVLLRKSGVYTGLLGFLSIIMLLLVTYYFRYKTSLFICFFMVFYSVYSIYVAVYLFPKIRPEALYYQFDNQRVYTIGMQCIFLFSLTVFFLVLNGRVTGAISFEKNSGGIRKRQMQYNPIIVIVCVILIIWITASNVAFGGANERMSSTALYEYKSVFFIIGMMYSGNRKAMKILWFVLVIVFGGISVFGGNRVEAVPLVIVYIYFYYDSIKPKYATIGMLAGIFVLISVGAFRQMIFRGGFRLQMVVDKITEEKLTFDTAYHAYVPSVASIAVAGKVPLAEKLRVLLGNIEYVFLGSKASGSDYTLPDYVQKYYFNVGGYVSPTYFYFWLGLFGAVLFGLLVYFYIRTLSRFENGKCKNVNTNLSIAVSAYFVSTVGRWFLYTPFPLIRSELLTALVALAAGAFDRVYQKRTARDRIRA